MPLRTQLYKYHAEHGKLIDFAGFEMPIWYKGIVPETRAVRNQVGVFDVSHMGRATIQGPKSERFLNFVTTNDVPSLKPGQAHYSLLCNENGGIKDDVVLLRPEQTRYVIVFNAGNRKKDVDWLTAQALPFGEDFRNISDETALISLQGPKARPTLQNLTKTDLSPLPRFGCVETEVGGVNCLVSRTGYTGENGYEILVWDSPIANPERAENVWNSILASGKEFAIETCGLGSRDVLRLEAGMCLYGNDIDETISPYEARLGFTVKLTKPDFIGKKALEAQKAQGTKLLRIGLRATAQGIPRPGCEIVKDTNTIGKLTSGTLSPTLNCGIGMGYVPREYANEGETFGIMVRGKRLDSVAVKFPFYETDKYGWQREP
ncbi:glycine cleavage system aminomethyltransferase GcvT [[Eubacterium] cellulosolvens]